MKKLLFLLVLALTLISCIDTTVSESTMNNLKHITIEKAKTIKPDSIVIVQEGYEDYVFIKKCNGDVILKAKYTSSSSFVDMPWVVIMYLLLLAFFVGLALGLILND